MTFKGRVPYVKCFVDGRDITGLLTGMLVEAVVTDGTGTEDDQLVITVDNPGDRFARPRKGAKVRFLGGYRDTGVRSFGTFILDDVEKTGPKRQLTIIARAGTVNDTLKEKKFRDHQEKTVGDLVSKIAKDHGLTAIVGKDLASIKVPFRAQLGESDIHLLTWLGQRLGAVATPKDRRLVFARKGGATSASGQALQTIRIGPDDLYGEDAYVLRGAARPRYGKIRAHYHDRGKPNLRKVEDGDDEGNLLQLPHTFQSEDEARAAIKGARSEADRGEEQLSLIVHGYPAVQADAKLIMTGVDNDGDGEWSIETAEHVWSGSDIYQTVIEAVRKEKTE